MKNIIPIFLTIDNNYVPFASVAIKSIMVNASKKYEYEIIILHQGLSDENIKNLLCLKCDRFSIRFEYIRNGLETITDRTENRLRCDYFTLTIYFRLFIPEMFKEYNKGIYIDSDVVVIGDISELYNVNLESNVIGACNDNSVVNVPELARYMENAVGVNRYEYINSGVLLMNLEEMRKKHFCEKFLKLLNTYHFDCIAPDQDYLNAMCNGKITYLDETWNVMSQKGKKEIKKPKLIHYNLFKKPWYYDNISYERYFWKYAKQTNYYSKIAEIKKSYSNEQKQSDNECFNFLIMKSKKIPENEKTFKKVMNNGEKIRI